MSKLLSDRETAKLKRGLKILDLIDCFGINFCDNFKAKITTVDGTKHLIFYNKNEDYIQVRKTVVDIVNAILTGGTQKENSKRMRLYDNKVRSNSYDIYTLTSIYYETPVVADDRKLRTLVRILDWLNEKIVY